MKCGCVGGGATVGEEVVGGRGDDRGEIDGCESVVVVVVVAPRSVLLAAWLLVSVVVLVEPGCLW